MMMNYFLSMDPSSSYFSINWIAMVLPFFLPMIFNFKFSRYSAQLLFLFKSLKKEIHPIIKSFNSSSSFLMFMSIFLLILLFNYMSLFPYIFTPTSHMTLNLSLSFFFWLTLMMYAWMNNSNSMFIHLTPQNTPKLLIPFMILIEIISQIIRPLTLSIRLSTNMIAGHLLLILLSSMFSSLSFYLLIMSFMPLLILIILETAVAFIQAYVFMILLVLYLKEIT